MSVGRNFVPSSPWLWLIGAGIVKKRICVPALGLSLPLLCASSVPTTRTPPPPCLPTARDSTAPSLCHLLESSLLQGKNLH